ncbi:MAG: hypothetical protein K0R27_3193 [Xanthobacteraceae bacterium]|nr:hypothetical protein [Xanthobacteraceae bacterium]
MSLSIHDVSVPVFVRAFGNLSAILDKAVEHAKANGLDEAELIEARLAPDMLTLAGQIQRASDSAKGAGARLTGGENPSFPDTETTFPELQARIARTVDYLNSLPPAAFEGAGERDVTLNVRRQPVTMKGSTYLLTFALPNFFFHVTTAYDILRHKGVGIGKTDYLGNS